jgi:hypothetical protein
VSELVRIRFIRHVVFRREPVGPGHEVDVTPLEAMQQVDGYKDAVRVDSEAPAFVAMTTEGAVIEHGDPVAAHRDPKPKRRR